MFMHWTSLQTVLQDITALSTEVQYSACRTVLLLFCFEYENFYIVSHIPCLNAHQNKVPPPWNSGEVFAGSICFQQTYWGQDVIVLVLKNYVLQTIKVEEPIEDDDELETKDETEKKDGESDDDDTKVEDDKQEEKPKTKTVEKTVWDWEVLNDSKPIWTRK